MPSRTRREVRVVIIWGLLTGGPLSPYAPCRLFARQGGIERQAVLQAGKPQDALHDRGAGDQAQIDALAVRPGVGVDEGAQSRAVHEAEPPEVDDEVGVARGPAVDGSRELRGRRDVELADRPDDDLTGCVFGDDGELRA